MKAAEVGDDAFGEDPTVNLLQEKAAERLGMEAALLVPSGTMGNGLALMVHTEPGDTFLSHERGHVMGRTPFHTAAGVEPRTFATEFGVIAADELADLVRSDRAAGLQPRRRYCHASLAMTEWASTT